ncbi:hypothetical protein HDU76_000127 [Blyttiomyces sp. JEL0837]|nr:hypothetical protein HDU76_000127 [Blyttiomyces sp. JEL0837]
MRVQRPRGGPPPPPPSIKKSSNVGATFGGFWFTPEERRVYESWFAALDHDGSKLVSTEEVLMAVVSSGCVDIDLVAEIWNVAGIDDTKASGYLCEADFYKFMRLLAHAQQGVHNITAGMLSQPVPPATLTSTTDKPSKDLTLSCDDPDQRNSPLPQPRRVSSPSPMTPDSSTRSRSSWDQYHRDLTLQNPPPVPDLALKPQRGRRIIPGRLPDIDPSENNQVNINSDPSSDREISKWDFNDAPFVRNESLMTILATSVEQLSRKDEEEEVADTVENKTDELNDVVEKLKEENRICREALRREWVIRKVLEERVRDLEERLTLLE